MPIAFQCPNIRFDHATQSRQRCGKKLQAPDSQAGVTVKCPRCRQPLKVPSNSKTAATQDVMELDFDDANSQRSANVVTPDRTDRCRKCGRPLDQKGVCSACHYIQPSLKNAETELDSIKVRPAGFQLWLIEIISEGLPVVVLTSMLHFLFAVMSVGMAALIVFATVGLQQVAYLALLLTVVFFYVALVYKAYDLMRNPYARLAWFQRPFWDLALWFSRKRDWANEKKRLVIDKRGVPLTDADLDKTEGLANASVLDLEATLITDDAFRFFYRMERLECLVLKNTDVTHANVVRLQQAKPNLWIWY
jgi:phage FluMu protein Com